LRRGQMRPAYALTVLSLVLLSGCVGEKAQVDNVTPASAALNGSIEAARSNFHFCERSKGWFSCYASVFKDAGVDAESCTQFNDSNIVYACMTGAAQRTRQPSLCGKIANDSFSAQCISEVGKSMNDASICDLTDDATYRDSCKWNIGYRFRNTTICDQIESDTIQAKCRMDIGLDEQDPAVCDMVRSVAYKSLCLDKSKRWARHKPHTKANTTSG
jgi:hypothetical protein